MTDDLDPGERMALKVAKAMIARGDEVPHSFTAVCVMALDRIARAAMDGEG